MSDTRATVDMAIQTNATWSDAFQFGDPCDTTVTNPNAWTLTGQNFRLDVKYARGDVTSLLTLTSDDAQIIVADVVQRVIYFSVPETVVTAALTPGDYVYELMMYDGSDPPIRVPLMGGDLEVDKGIAGG